MGSKGSGQKPDRNRRGLVKILRARGLSLGQIAEALGCDRHTVAKHLKALGAGPPEIHCPRCGAVVRGVVRGPLPDPAPLCLGCLARDPGATLAERLRARRYAAGLSLSDLARRAGLPIPTVAALETLDRRPRPRTLERLAEALVVEPAELDPQRGEGA